MDCNRSVTVVITTYNHADFLAEAIDSVIGQNHPADKIIVVDDGSSDDPGTVVASRPEVQFIRQRNQGLGSARNTGLWAASSEAIVFLDAGDRLLPNAPARPARGADCCHHSRCPGGLAVLRLSTSSYLVGCCTRSTACPGECNGREVLIPDKTR
jgi:glycosyltransferase involved in cell wall biosynthesis